LQLAHLGSGFGLYLCGINSPAQGGCGQFTNSRAETWPAIAGEQSGHLVRGKKGFAVYQNNVAANVELRRVLSAMYCLCKGPAACHQCSRSDNAALVRFQDGAIDAGGEAKIVSIDD
jgi:hypothetical protein